MQFKVVLFPPSAEKEGLILSPDVAFYLVIYTNNQTYLDNFSTVWFPFWWNERNFFFFYSSGWYAISATPSGRYANAFLATSFHASFQTNHCGLKSVKCCHLWETHYVYHRLKSIFLNFTYDDCNIQIACIISISAQCALSFKPILLILIWRWYEDWSSYELNSYSIYLIGYGIHSVLIKHQYVQITLYLANICLYNLTYVYVYYVSQETLLILWLQIYTYMCKFTMNWIPIAAKGAIIYINSSLFCTQCLISYAIIFQQ